MPSLIDMRRRIRSVRNTQQITKAMKMISAARLRRSQERVFNARPYAGLLKEVLASLGSRSASAAHPLLTSREPQRATAIVLTGDRGLCGAFNANVIRAAEQFIAGRPGQQVDLIPVGRKGRDYFRRQGVAFRAEYTGIYGMLDYSHAKLIGSQVISAFTEAETDAVFLIYNEFKSVLSQRVVVEQLLPLSAFQQQAESPPADVQVDYLYEQPPARILETLLPRYVEVQIFRGLLESIAAEHAARMTAMDSATGNAGEMIDSLTLTMNRIRQASITKEIIEVVSGAGAAG